MIERSGCDFTMKVENAQKAGAAMAIIFDDEVDIQELIIMGDDGYGGVIDIPAIFLDYQDGQALIKLMEEV